ncbi:NUDIX hydrolase [Insolitispirillum peregrinum]|uniref:ADP-ribose pyrophosphatase YjhB, NUDIX family n=1 Tax=Insolitispirillum peregrinum TaxID=80876 RepID=A0A1N7MCV8_9PROT|nr:NUDIX hydrolase [Insolitispirillum peregrinum]SIS83819.1 ADP-ribose pyrophosphatase YjhB, NUDIX family [Insolitispirillum peregrinum]
MSGRPDEDDFEDDLDEVGDEDDGVTVTSPAPVPSMPVSRYPRGPQPAVLAVVVREERLLLVQRKNPPDAGCWGFPGGRLMLGETLAAGAVRELREETAVEAVARHGTLPAAFASLDVIERDIVGAVRYHFVLTAVLCQWQSGDGVAGDDAADCAWRTLPEILALDQAGQTSAHVADLARMALAIDRRLPDAEASL